LLIFEKPGTRCLAALLRIAYQRTLCMKNFTRQSESASRESKTDLFVSARFRTEELRELKGPALSVLLAYRSHANAQGVAWPSLGALAKTTGYGINAIKAARRKLISSGYLIPVEQMREGGKFGRKFFKVSTVGHKQCHGTAALSTVALSIVAPSTVGHKQCQEGSPAQGSPAQGFPVKGNPANAVRRLVDAELRDVHQPEIQGRGFPPSKPSPKGEASEPKRQGFSLKRKKKLGARIADKLLETGNTLDRDLDDEEREAFAYLRYKPKDEPRNLPNGFVWTLFDVYDDHKDDLPLPGNLCSKIIDRCMSEQKGYKTLGMDPSEYYYPLDFVEHRNRLREQERSAEKSGGRP
jgi:Helix-turn-helix domain